MEQGVNEIRTARCGNDIDRSEDDELRRFGHPRESGDMGMRCASLRSDAGYVALSGRLAVEVVEIGRDVASIQAEVKYIREDLDDL